MELTPNLQLKKPAGSDRAKQIPFNENSDILDQLIGGANMGTEATSITGAIAEHSAAISGIEGAGYAKSVNNVAADSSGNIELTRVLYADNLVADDAQSSSGTFVERTTGGEASLSDGDAWLTQIRGNSIHTGFVPESLNLTVNMATRETPAAITAVLDAATYTEYVGTAGTTFFSYTADAWNLNPAAYGITITNTPVNGDAITVIWDGENDPEMTVNAMPRTAPASLVATVDRDTFVAYVASSTTLTFTYNGSAWSGNLALYGITTSGDTISGDEIVVTYVKEVRGTITVTSPDKFTSTGWNLYNHSKTYARVLKYHDTYGFGVSGTYTKLQFSATESGAKSDITVTDGKFTIPSDGYVWVTGGNNTNTAIWMTWSDWTNGYDGDFAVYTESVIDGSGIMEHFPNGLMMVGNVRDVVDFSINLATSNIERMAYSAANLAIAKASGRAYEYDENYIYIVRETPVTYEFTLVNKYTASDHGMEIFSGTTVPCFASMLYGQNLKDKLRTDVVTKSQDLVNGFTETGSGKALDARAGKTLNDALAKQPYTATTGNNNRNAAFHNSIYRGKYLGSSVTAAQYSQIDAGTFDDLFVGDYWTIGGQDWVICDFDYYYRCGSTDITKHHVVLMPRTAMNIPAGTALYGVSPAQTLSFINASDVSSKETATAFKWNATAAAPNTHSTAGGYKFSRMRTVIMRAANTIVINLFGSSHVLAFTELYYNPSAATDSGLASGWAWFEGAAGSATEKSICDLCNETMVYGQQVWGEGSAFGNQGYEVGIDKFQLSIFALNREFANIRADWWLRSVYSATYAARVSYYGNAAYADSAYAYGVRPRFLLVG